jgi:chemotaxis protein CheX
VQYLGAQCLQVLLSAASSWCADGVSLRIVNRATAFVRGLELAGIAPTTFAE